MGVVLLGKVSKCFTMGVRQGFEMFRSVRFPFVFGMAGCQDGVVGVACFIQIEHVPVLFFIGEIPVRGLLALC